MVKINPILTSSTKVGIWGFGVVGKSIMHFLAQKSCKLSVLEQRALEKDEITLLKNNHVQIVDYAYIQQFLEFNDYIIASPGVDITPYTEFQDKFITELDLFYQYIPKNTFIIAITGSAGKTSTVTLLTGLLNALGKKAIAIGNIGTAMFDTISTIEKYDYIVMELSSFQLENIKAFSPKIAAITNFIPNHLDRHKTIENYLDAKGRLLKHQTEECHAFIPMEYMEPFWSFIEKQKTTWIGNDSFQDITKELSDISVAQNWRMVLSIIDHLKLPTEDIIKYAHSIKLPEHRVEFVRNYKGVRFYNDSKSTLLESTQEALKRFSDDSVILFLGGLSKGVDRKPLINSLSCNIKKVICFGKEAHILSAWCLESGITTTSHKTLESAFTSCIQSMKNNDVVLFSPSGSSFDLFKNYQERGAYFKKLVQNLKN